MHNEPALLGGKPIREAAIPWVSTMGNEEREAVDEVMRTGVLSAYLGKAGDGFLGGSKVKEIEADYVKRFRANYAISVNSATTALHTAIAACEAGPGDEVLVSPYTMVASASAILMNNAVPVFVDIDEDTFTMNPNEIEKWITPRTKAIMTVNLFGLPSRLNEIMDIARKHGLYVIEDNAQSPGAAIDGKEAGTFGHLGVFSLNYHKIIHSGEGGMILTDDKKLAYRCQLIRNHGEVVADDLHDADTVVLGSNYRMSELHAAIGIAQLNKLDEFLAMRRRLARQLTDGLKAFAGLKGVVVPEGYTHSYYIYPIRFMEGIWGMKRSTFASAMKAEGFPLGEGYVKPIYMMNLYQHKRVYNQTQYPFALIETPAQRYEQGICPVVERMYERELLTADVCRVPFSQADIRDFLDAVAKLWERREALRRYEQNLISRA